MSDRHSFEDQTRVSTRASAALKMDDSRDSDHSAECGYCPYHQPSKLLHLNRVLHLSLRVPALKGQHFLNILRTSKLVAKSKMRSAFSCATVDSGPPQPDANARVSTNAA
jgi:hypothetical protein